MNPNRSAAAAIALGALAALSASASASASTIAVDGPSTAIFPGPNGVDFLVDTVAFRYVADPGETNAVTATRTPTGWTFTDPGAVIAAPACAVSADRHSATCARPATANRPREILFVSASDGDDDVRVEWPAAQSPSLIASGAALAGGDGDDTLVGGDLADDVNGGPGNDLLDGGAGDDQITGRAGRDTLSGGVGDDLLESRDGDVDIDDCGPGNDRAFADPGDQLTACESDSRPPLAQDAQPGAPAAVPDRTAPTAVVGLPARPRRIATILRRGLLVSVRASEASTVRAGLHRGTARGRTVARRRRTLRSSGRVRIRLHLTPSARRQLVSARSARLTVRVTITDQAGNRRTVDRRLTVRR